MALLVRGDRQQTVLVAPQIAARLKRTQHGTIGILTLAVARQSLGAVGRGDRQQTVFVAPQKLKRFYEETPIAFVAPQNFSRKKGHLCRTKANEMTCYSEHAVRGC